MWTWLAGAGVAGFKRWVWIAGIGALVLVAILCVKIASNWFDSVIDTAEDSGAKSAIIAGQSQTLDQLGDANDAEQELEAGGERSPQRYADCLLDAVEPSGCERYNPDAGE